MKKTLRLAESCSMSNCILVEKLPCLNIPPKVPVLPSNLASEFGLQESIPAAIRIVMNLIIFLLFDLVFIFVIIKVRLILTLIKGCLPL